MTTIRQQIAALPYPYRAMAERYEFQQGWSDPFPDSNWDKLTDDWQIIGFDRRNSEEGKEFWDDVSLGKNPPIPTSEWIWDEVNFAIWQYCGWGGTKENLEIDAGCMWHWEGMELGEVGFVGKEEWLRYAYNKAGIKDADLSDVWKKALELYCMIKEGIV